LNKETSRRKAPDKCYSGSYLKGKEKSQCLKPIARRINERK
jgi:hypothetical protein